MFATLPRRARAHTHTHTHTIPPAHQRIDEVAVEQILHGREDFQDGQKCNREDHNDTMLQSEQLYI